MSGNKPPFVPFTGKSPLAFIRKNSRYPGFPLLKIQQPFSTIDYWYHSIDACLAARAYTSGNKLARKVLFH
jgi:hypothetical protein